MKLEYLYDGCVRFMNGSKEIVDFDEEWHAIGLKPQSEHCIINFHRLMERFVYTNRNMVSLFYRQDAPIK